MFQFIKKNDKQIVSNYRPVSFLLTCRKIFEKLIYNERFAFFEKRKLLSEHHQSGFRSGDFCICHFLAVTPGIFPSFDSKPFFGNLRNILRHIKSF